MNRSENENDDEDEDDHSYVHGKCPHAPVMSQVRSWLVKREFLKNDVQRGRECRQQVRRELESLRAQLSDWAAYERICGRNPCSDLVQAPRGEERIENFLPEWSQQQEEQIAALTRKNGTLSQT